MERFLERLKYFSQRKFNLELVVNLNQYTCHNINIKSSLSSFYLLIFTKSCAGLVFELFSRRNLCFAFSENYAHRR